MPQPVLHVLIARQTLERWRRLPATAPFHPDAPGVLESFLHGALAPDMGFFPGSHKPISHLVHTERTGAIVRALHARARTDVERLADTYDRLFPSALLARSHRNVTRFYRLYVLLAGVIAAEVGEQVRRPLVRLAHLRRLFGGVLEPGSQASGFIEPVVCSRGFVEESDAALGRVHHAIDEHVAHELRHLADWNLDEGQLIDGATHTRSDCVPAAA